MKKFLLVSDTHGNLEQLDALVKKTEADAVIHAGDFGFYDDDSIHRLQTRELRLIIAHSTVQERVLVTKSTERKDLIDLIQKHKLFGDFPDYLENKKTFAVPVYAVWGNHEDLAVVEKLRNGVALQNLFLLDERRFYEIEPGLILCGIGGNWIPGKKLFDLPVAGAGGKIWATLSEFGSLYEKVGRHDGQLIFVSHVSPGKEPQLVRLVTHFAPDLWISGHMGAPYPCFWNPFAIHSEQEYHRWLQQSLQTLDDAPEKMGKEARGGYHLLQKPLPPLEKWYKRQWYLNLPDASDGYAVLTIDQGRFSLQTYGKGIRY